MSALDYPVPASIDSILMRRSTNVVAPLLTSAAIAVLSGCASASPCAPPQVCSQPSEQTLFGGFGQTFREHPIEWSIAGVFIWLIVRSSGS